MNPGVDQYIAKQEKWTVELNYLRSVLLECGYTEAIKWGAPCYMYQQANIVGMNGFKHHFALWFYKGALLHDAHKILIKPQKDTHGMRQLRFTNLGEVIAIEPQIKAYLFEAIEAEKAGLKLPNPKKIPLEIPGILQKAFDESNMLKTAFDQLSHGKKKAYVYHIASAKQEATKQRRLDKIIPLILEQKGLNDEYL